MARLFPLRSDAQSAGDEPRVVDLEDEDADAVFGALSSSTAREIYSRLSEEPGTPSDVAEAVDSSIQNVRYHLEKLEDAGLVEVVDTWYSSRGNEMSVYATADGPLIVTSDESTASKVRSALSRFLGGVGALAAGSLLVQYGLQRYAMSGIGADAGAAGGSDGSSGDAGGSGGNAGAGGDAETMDDRSGGDGSSSDGGTTNDGSTNGGESAGDGSAADSGDTGGDIGTAQHDGSNGSDGTSGDGTGDGGADSASGEGGDTAGTADHTGGGSGAGSEHEVADDGGILGDVFGDNAAETADTVFSTVPPGLLFFLGGLSVLICVTVYWYWRSY